MTKKNVKRDPKSYRIGVYVRVSTEEQAVNPEGSIKNQEQRLREYVKLKNMVEHFGEITAVFSDQVSAKDINRPAFQKMLGAIERGDINLILVTELSRFSRSTKDFSMLQEFLEEHGCKFLSLRENFDTSGAAGSMVLNMMASIAEFERRQTAERVSLAFLSRAKRGLYNGGSVPIGYRIDSTRPGYLVVDEGMVDLVRSCFNAFLKHETLAATCKFLNTQNLRFPKRVFGGGGAREPRITIDALYRMLRNKAYLGIRVFNTKSGVEEVPAVWEAIIDEDLFAKVNRMLKKNRHHKRTHADQRYPYTLSGLVFCSECGDRMSGKSAHGCSGTFGYYEHGKRVKLQASLNERLPKHSPVRIPAKKIEPVVWREVKRFVQSDAFARDLLDRARAMREAMNQQDEVQKLKRLAVTTAAQIEVFAERIASLPKDFDHRPLIAQMTRLKQLKLDLDGQATKAAKLEAEHEEPVILDNLKAFRVGLRDLIKKGEKDKDLQTAIIRKVVHKITIQMDGFEIHFHVGQSHYSRELGHRPGSRLFLCLQSQNLAKSRKKLSVCSSTLLTNGDHGED